MIKIRKLKYYRKELNDLPKFTEQMADPITVPSGLSPEPALLTTRIEASVAPCCVRAFALAILPASNKFTQIVARTPPSHRSDLNLNVTSARPSLITPQNCLSCELLHSHTQRHGWSLVFFVFNFQRVSL